MLSMIPVSEQPKLKNGTIKAYTILREGKSKPKLLGVGSVTMNWTKDVIESASKTLKRGMKFFTGHGKGTNGHENRKPLYYKQLSNNQLSINDN